METTFGVLDPPLGKVRLSIAGLIAAAISSSSFLINEAVAKTGTLNVLLVSVFLNFFHLFPFLFY